MRINGIRFEEDKPDQVTLSLSIDEAGHIARHLGRLAPNTTDPRESYTDCAHLYYLLASKVFNAYWDDGIDDWARERQS